MPDGPRGTAQVSSQGFQVLAIARATESRRGRPTGQRSGLALVLSVLLSGQAASLRAQTPGAATATPPPPPSGSSQPAAAPEASEPVSEPAPEEAQLTAIARALFEEGLGFVDSEAWLDAADRFSRLLAIRYSAVAAYNLALARAHLGKYVVAAEMLRKVLADASLDPSVRAAAQRLQAEVDSKIGSLTVKVEGDATGCVLYVDDQAWPRAAWGVAAPVDPGEHIAQLRKHGSVRRTVTASVAPGGNVATVLSLQPVPPPAAVASAAQRSDSTSAPGEALAARDDDERGRGGVLRSPWFWAGVGAVIIVGATVGIAAAASSGDPAPAKAVKGDFMPSVIEGSVQ